MTRRSDLTAAEVDAMARALSARTGLDLSGAQRRRLDALVARKRRPAAPVGTSEPAQMVAADDTALGALLDELTVGETYFFREPAHFALLRERIVPNRIDPHSGHPLSVWSAGCASGEEAYSVAITLDELGMLGRSRIVGTDVSPAALRRAAAGTYRPWSLRRCRDRDVAKWFSRDGDTFRLEDRYRTSVDWRMLNLVDGPPGHSFDVVLCRNVLIYLTTQAVAAATTALHDALAPGGWLLAGAADPPLGHPGLHRVPHRGAVVYRRADPSETATPPGRQRSAADHEPRPAPPEPRQAAPERPRPRAHPPSPRRRPSTVSGWTTTSQGTGDAAPTHAGATDPRLDAAAKFAAAVEHLDAGHLDEAARAASAALYLEPDFVAAHLVLAAIHERLERRDRARACYRAAAAVLARMPADAEVPHTGGESVASLAASITNKLRAGR